MLKAIPRDYFDPSKGTLKLLWEEEWRGLGITQSLGWEHYEVHEPEPHILLFKSVSLNVPGLININRSAGDLLIISLLSKGSEYHCTSRLAKERLIGRRKNMTIPQINYSEGNFTDDTSHGYDEMDFMNHNGWKSSSVRWLELLSQVICRTDARDFVVRASMAIIYCFQNTSSCRLENFPPVD